MPLVWRRAAEKKVANMPQFAGALVALVALGELAGRVVFYATRVKIGLGLPLVTIASTGAGPLEGGPALY